MFWFLLTSVLQMHAKDMQTQLSS